MGRRSDLVRLVEDIKEIRVCACIIGSFEISESWKDCLDESKK